MLGLLQRIGISFFLFLGWLSFIQAQQLPKTPYAPYGGVFTPKGTLRVLFVFVTYKDKSSSNPNFENKNYPLPDWNYTSNNKLPDFVDKETGNCPQYIFNKVADFEKYMDEVPNNFSKEFALMSNGQFKLIGDVFKDANGKPTVVEIDPTGGYSWSHLNGRAVEAMQKINPNVDLSRFDQRKNLPNFKFDNSDTSLHKPDGILDFVVFVHRYNKNWKEAPKPGMRGWTGSGGGFAATGVLAKNRINGYRIAEGFTMTYRSGVFVHEVAHVLFNAPHIMGVNNVVGDYFYLLSAGWGIMSPISMFRGFNAWERWYTGFSDLVADVKTAEDLKANNVFVLRDFFTTGDAMRIQIPFSGGQYLWLENHAKLHPMDEHPWKGSVVGVGDTVAGSAKGIYAYVEAIESSRNVIFSPLSSRANGIKVLHAGGNYDYHLYEELPDLRNNWGNVMKSFKRMQENPISGINNLYRFPYDKNKDGIIKIDPNYNSSRTEWFVPIFREEVQPDSFVNIYGCYGVYNAQKCQNYSRPVAFRAGDYLDMSSNPMPLNYPKYNLKEKKLAPYKLNGLALKFSKIEHTNDMKVEVRFGQTSLCQDRRWTGNIQLPNITGDDQADLEVAPCITLTLDKSGTTNTHVQTEAGDFVHPTVFTVKSGATLHLKQRAKLIVKANSKLIVEEGAKIRLDKKARIIIKPSAEFIFKKGAIEKHNRAKVIRERKS
ncbi:metallopeptidase domain-containing protein [Aureispira anguillae]|uniref:M6 family metalloprotease domain-containing protein n=1 Tax=Aureispira anguillae TaxID=2864201 RepID=A0A916DUH1_9BACT|nr:hypothetical protein [Aureispira anguillae]BDS12687.1 hypothetical protein AsAng_0034110 [Aureispira anguillae]